MSEIAKPKRDRTGYVMVEMEPPTKAKLLALVNSRNEALGGFSVWDQAKVIRDLIHKAKK